ncbi:DUF2852 domain-containing protein [Rhabdaerophilum sp.]|uniref:DUF2852 domain-containing protein n=1 Tax=Rhabdaerophilum sp. TaxID=2717341 RepID=UPI0038D39D27
MTAMVERLDGYGRGGWIAAMVLGFVLFWPVGLAILFYMIWSGRMGCNYNSTWGGNSEARWQRKMDKMQMKMERWNEMRHSLWGGNGGGQSFAPTGNRAFDEYRTETIRRLEDEAREFKDFLERLRLAKDKAEFDQFMADRRNAPPERTEEDRSPKQG